MSRLLYGIALLCLTLGIVDLAVRAHSEAVVLMLVAALFGGLGFAVSRAATKRCPHCAERIKAAAAKCRFCGSQVQTEKVPRPANQQR